jgi:hypothetical protein
LSHTTGLPPLSSRQPSDDPIIHGDDAPGEVLIVRIGIAQGDDDYPAAVLLISEHTQKDRLAAVPPKSDQVF